MGSSQAGAKSSCPPMRRTCPVSLLHELPKGWVDQMALGSE